MGTANEARAKEMYKRKRAHAKIKLRSMRCRYYAERAKELQTAHEKHDTRAMFVLAKLCDGGQKSAAYGAVRDKNGALLVEPALIKRRWNEHFQELLNCESAVDWTVIEALPSMPEISALADPIGPEEVRRAVAQMKNCKAPGVDGVAADVWKYGGERVVDELEEMIRMVWESGRVPQEWKDSQMCVLFKKGDRTLCGNYRGIALLSTAGKVMMRLLVNRMVKALESQLPEAQCGFRAQRSTVDMMFSARQLQEKCREQRRPLYWCFVDLTKAYDTVHRGALWRVLEKQGVPLKVVGLMRDFHDGMKSALLSDDGVSESFEIKNGLRQGCVMAPNAFLLYLAAVLTAAFEDLAKDEDAADGVWIRFRNADDKLFNVRGLARRNKVSRALIFDLLFADDMGICAHSESALQRIMTRLACACGAFGLTISLSKTEVMVQRPATPTALVPAHPRIVVNGTVLKEVDQFTYLGGVLSSDGLLDTEIRARCQKAAVAFGRLRRNVFDRRDVALVVKLQVYRAAVLAALLYGCETWVISQRLFAKLEAVQWRCLRCMLHIKWHDMVPNVEVLRRAGCELVETVVRTRRLQWLGHVTRMERHRIPRRLLFGELDSGSRAAGGQKMRWKDAVKRDFKVMGIDFKRHSDETWLLKAHDRSAWRQVLTEGRRHLEEAKQEHAVEKRAKRHCQPSYKKHRAANALRVLSAREASEARQDGKPKRRRCAQPRPALPQVTGPLVPTLPPQPPLHPRPPQRHRPAPTVPVRQPVPPTTPPPPYRRRVSSPSQKRLGNAPLALTPAPPSTPPPPSQIASRRNRLSSPPSTPSPPPSERRPQPRSPLAARASRAAAREWRWAPTPCSTPAAPPTPPPAHQLRSPLTTRGTRAAAREWRWDPLPSPKPPELEPPDQRRRSTRLYMNIFANGR
jgi:hypothetical protein